MDPASHAALGRTLVALGWNDSKRRAVTAAGVLGALSPDIDAVFMPAGWDIYLRVHEVGTHTVLGTLACAALTGGVMRVASRTCSWRLLSAAAWLGAASHVLLDLMSSARLRLLWPLLDPQMSLPLVAMADPWLAAILIAGGVASALVSRQAHGRRAATITVAAGAALLLWKAAGAVRAVHAYDNAASRGDTVQAHIVEAEWASLTGWRVLDRTATHVRAWRAGSDGGTALLLSWPLETETPLVTASRSLSTVRNFHRAHQLGFAVTLPRSADELWVLWSDVRYCWKAETGATPADLTVSAGGGSLRCALWFGGAFAPDGTPLLEIVKIGSFTQTRAPAR